VSDAVDEHLAKALASLADVSARQLHATAEALERRRSGLRDFVSVFRDVAYSREFGSDLKHAAFHLRQAVENGGDELAERIADAEAPFWRHVRNAVALISANE
jgi:DNA topoisomerase IB